jgi:AbrB family looped-hinge helix DNA binding protein
MRNQARITSKGQITVPNVIRQALGVRPGDSLLFQQDADGVRVLPVRPKSPFEKYRGIGNPGIPSGRKALVRWFRDFRGNDQRFRHLVTHTAALPPGPFSPLSSPAGGR